MGDSCCDEHLGIGEVKALLEEELAVPVYSVAIGGSEGNEGVTSLVMALAVAMAESGSSVVVVDANLNSPDLTQKMSMADRYGLREVLVVADRSRLADAWELAASLVEDRLLGAEPDVDLSPGPHPRRPGERVDVGFVDEDPDDDLEIEIVEDPGPEGEA